MYEPNDSSIRQPITGIRSCQVLMACDELSPTLEFLTRTLGLRIDAIFPADNPSTAMLSGHGLSLRLGVGLSNGVKELRLLCDDPYQLSSGARELVAPNGVSIRLEAADPPVRQPETRQALALSHLDEDTHWNVGRAGLRYRDLLPERHGGAFIASHIRILDGGPVPDYTHFHKVRFQTIFCRKGWVRVVYEGQGEPFEMHAGDCVLQPPTIRHRVLASSAGAEVVELSSPAEHITVVDHEMVLPTPASHPARDFDGQRFVRHVAKSAKWGPWRIAGFEASDTQIGHATQGVAGVRVVRPVGEASCRAQAHNTELCFFFVLSGSLDVVVEGDRYTLAPDASITIPGNTRYAFERYSEDLQLLEITLPEKFLIGD
ncbi:cupin domain-containing protein [Paraburkholderia flagellata]|uniref:cupin domain-containing protein n=1 Tax=Paraburkholderia flagellata TaxID=2883241 RepID=UPI001F4520DD|nr:cupin domain-containing protein [Paraburkholderia flagellata]